MKRNHVAALIIFILILVNKLSAQFVFNMDSSAVLTISKWKYQAGDYHEWSKPEFNDSAWAVIDNSDPIQLPAGNYYFRAAVFLEGNIDVYDYLNLYLAGAATAYEIYWDGRLIGRNGRVGTNLETESPALTVDIVPLKHEQTSAGLHIITVRLSNYRELDVTPLLFCQLAYTAQIKKNIQDAMSVYGYDAGLFLLAALFSLALFAGGGRHRSHLLFAVFCLTHLLYPIFIIYLYYVNLPVQYLPVFNTLIFFSAPLGGVFLNLFFLYNYPIPEKRTHLIGVISITIITLIINEPFILTLLNFYSAALLAYAVSKKEPGSIIALIGTITYSILFLLFYLDLVFYIYLISEVVFLFAIMLSISLQIKEEEKQLAVSKIRSARLETELLKKNIQPHFLMNTLLSIKSWMDENPHKAGEIIQSLADEFRIINKISDKREISLRQELQLCKTHLELMSARMDSEYKLKISDIDLDNKVPPMIFHTLIENGITHGFGSENGGTFELTCHQDEQIIRYNLRNKIEDRYITIKKDSADVSEGMGIKYVRTRLEESYPGNWDLEFGGQNGYWEVRITILLKQ